MPNQNFPIGEDPTPNAPVDTALPEKVCSICGQPIVQEAGRVVTEYVQVGDNVEPKEVYHCFACDPITAGSDMPPAPPQYDR